LLRSFTGGDTGIAISKKAGMVPLQMELGGKDACIVLEDADLDLVAANIVKGGFSYRYYIMILTIWNFIEQNTFIGSFHGHLNLAKAAHNQFFEECKQRLKINKSLLAN
jgi:hypothetical protein